MLRLLRAVRGARRLCYIDVPAIYAAMGEGDVRKGLLIGNVVRVDAVTQERYVCVVERLSGRFATGTQSSGNNTQRDIRYVVGNPAAVGISGGVTREKAHALAVGESRWSD